MDVWEDPEENTKIFESMLCAGSDKRKDACPVDKLAKKGFLANSSFSGRQWGTSFRTGGQEIYFGRNCQLWDW